MSIFDFDIKRWIYNMLPTFLRKQNITDFLEALTAPLKRLHELFTTNRNGNLYRLMITPQVCKLEKMLNDRYDAAQRRITIEDGEFVPNQFIYQTPEKLPIYLHTDDENNPVNLFQASEFGSSGSDFIINVPASVAFEPNELTALVNMYKLASKTFSIHII